MHLLTFLLTVLSTIITSATAQNDYFSTTITAPPNPHATGCPTITATTNQCRTCSYPQCLYLTTVTQRCACPKDPFTSFTSFPCELRCTGNVGCITSWSVVTATGCSSSTSGSSSSSKSKSKSSSSSSTGSDSTSTSKSKSRHHSTDTGFCGGGGTSEYTPSGTHTQTHPYFTHSFTKTGSATATATGTGTRVPFPPATSGVVISSGSRRRLAPFRFW